MHQQLELLIMLNDLDTLVKESQNKNLRKKEESYGFKLAHHSVELARAREEIVRKLDKNLYETYERLMSKYGRAVAPVMNGICYGCYMRLPIADTTQQNKNEKVSTCINCGRFLYWIG